MLAAMTFSRRAPRDRDVDQLLDRRFVSHVASHSERLRSAVTQLAHKGFYAFGPPSRRDDDRSLRREPPRRASPMPLDAPVTTRSASRLQLNSNGFGLR